jgi:hypothetical protein
MIFKNSTLFFALLVLIKSYSILSKEPSKWDIILMEILEPYAKDYQNKIDLDDRKEYFDNLYKNFSQDHEPIIHQAANDLLIVINNIPNDTNSFIAKYFYGAPAVYSTRDELRTKISSFTKEYQVKNNLSDSELNEQMVNFFAMKAGMDFIEKYKNLAGMS